MLLRLHCLLWEAGGSIRLCIAGSGVGFGCTIGAYTAQGLEGGVGGRLCALLCTAGGAQGGLGELSAAALPKAEGRLGELSGATPPRPTLTNQHPDW